MTHVFRRVLTRELPVAARAEGVWIEDTQGRRYLDGAGGAIVVNVGHGDRAVIDAMAEQASRVQYVHGTMFTTDALEAYADDVSTILPMDDPRIYPVSGGSEAVETALKLARSYHLARGEDRAVVIGRMNSYHGNTLGALDVGGKRALKAPYAPWLGRSAQVDAAYEYRCTNPSHPSGCAVFLADLCRAVDLTVSLDFMAISPYAGAGPAVRITKDLDDDIEGKDVLVVEDIIDTGLTLHYLLGVLRSRHPASLRVCTLLDKDVRRIADMPIAFRGFEIPDRFVVGYGLDLGGRFRNLPFVATLKDEVMG